MLLENDINIRKSKRACIYFIYDAQGIVDDYVLFALKEFKKNCDYLLCVSNGKLRTDSLKKITNIADSILERENRGNDIGAYKAALKNLTWTKIRQFDELILVNFTCFGPIFPLKELFSWAEKQHCDFWSLTQDTKSDIAKKPNYLHKNSKKTHYQSYFLAIRDRLLKSEILEKFFNEIPDDVSYTESGLYYEYAFPGYFEERGFIGSVLCDDNNDLNYPLLFNPVHLLTTYRTPFIKIRSFSHHYSDVLRNAGGEASQELLTYINKQTNYDIKFIWDYLLRTKNLADIVRCAQLNRVLPKEIQLKTDSPSKLKVGVVCHIYYKDTIDSIIQYLKNFPESANILITTSKKENYDIILNIISNNKLNCELYLIPNRGRDVASLLVAAKNFVQTHDIVCFIHDKKTSQIKPYSIGRSWQYKLLENTCGSPEYVGNVINLFEAEPRLGIAFPSFPNHGNYGANLETGWTNNFHTVEKLLTQFNIDVKINENTLCVAPMGTCFWFRSIALRQLFSGITAKGWDWSDFPAETIENDGTLLHAIERSYAYFSQANKFYPVYLYTDKYAAIELTNLELLKIGSRSMAGWLDYAALKYMGLIKDSGNEEKKLQQLKFFESRYINYGIRLSLIHLATAIHFRFPRIWNLLAPLRYVMKKMLKL